MMAKSLLSKSYWPTMIIAAFSFLFLAHVGQSGRTHITSTTGCSCHSSSTNCVVTITGPDTVATNSVNIYTITISGTGSSLGGGAIDIATNSGTIVSSDSYLAVSGTTNTEIVSASRKPATSGTITYVVNYTAPTTTGSAKLCATGIWTNGSGSSGDYWAFAPDKAITIISTATTVPDVPVLVSPASGAIDQPKFGMQFVWNRAANAEKYTFQIGTSNAFSTILYSDTTLIDSSVVLPNIGLQNATTYYWRVLARNTIGSSTWSNVNNFTTIAGAPLSGIKTVGGIASDYTTLRGALADLSAQGTTAPGVTFVLKAGTYAEDTLVIQTTTASASAPVIITPESGASVAIIGAGSATSPFVIKVDNTSFVTIDGGASRSLTISGSSANAQRGVLISGNSPYCNVKNCIIRSGAYSSNSCSAVELSSGVAKAQANYSKIDGNIIRNAYYGIRLTGNGASDSLLNVTISNNLIDSVAIGGIYTTNTAYGKIYGNDVSVLLGGGAALTSAMYGIYAGSNTDYIRIYNNRVHDINQQSTSSSITYGISTNTGAAGHGGNVIYNNMVNLNITQANGTGSIYPLYISESTFPDSVLFNTVKLQGSGTGVRSSTCFYKGSVTGSCVVKNNVLINLRTDATTGIATAIGRPSTGTTATMVSDYNDLYTGTDTAQHKIGRFSTASYYNTLALWAAANAGDASSISQDVSFLSDTDLHINSGVTSGLKNAGVPIPGYTTDIDGDIRNTTHPDIGADEFSGNITAVSSGNIYKVDDMELSQNFPNPFNPSTEIHFSVRNSQYVTLKAYSITGTEVATLFEGFAEANTKHAVTFNASALPSGIYYYVLNANNQLAVKKMTLLK